MKDNFVNSIIKYSIPSLFSFILGIVAVFVLTNIFTSEDYATISIFNNNSALIVSIVYLGFDSLYIRFFNESSDESNRNELGISCCLVSCLIWGIFGTVAIVLFGNVISIQMFGISSLILEMSLLINVFSQLIIRYTSIKYRMSFKPKLYGFLTVALQFINKLFLAIFVLLTKNVEYVLGLNTLVLFLFCVVFVLIRRKDYVPFSIKHLFAFRWDMIRYALFSMPMPILINLNSFITQEIIKKKFGNSEYGIYATAYYFVSLLSALQSGFTTFWSAYMFTNYDKHQDLIKKTHDYVQLFIIIFYACLLIFKDFIYIFIGENYHDSKLYFGTVLIFPIMMLLSETTIYGLSIYKKNYYTVLIYAFSLLVNLFCSCQLSNTLGVKGVALGSAIAGILFYCLSSFIGQHYYKSINSVWKSCAGFICIILLAFFGMFKYNIVYIAIILLFAMFLYYKEIFGLFNYIKEIVKK